MSAWDEQLAMERSPAIDSAAAPGEQRSVEWLYERVGKVTASRFKDVMAKLKTGAPAKAREDYVWEIVVERLTGKPSEHYASAAMQHGIDNESLARATYEARTGALVTQAGFVHHPEIEGVGGSPDGLVDADGGMEAKCPFNSAIHLRTILDGMPDEHVAQVQGLMWVNRRQWWDFVSFDPRLPKPFDIYVQRIPRDDAYIARLEAEIRGFLKDVDAILARLNVHPTPKGTQ